MDIEDVALFTACRMFSPISKILPFPLRPTGDKRKIVKLSIRRASTSKGSDWSKVNSQ